MHVSNVLPAALALAVFLGGALPSSRPAARPEEGMWTFDNLPLKDLKEKYGFEPTQEWLDKVRLSSVRFDTGGSGSFVSPNGLVMTNHHVALTTVHKLTEQRKNEKDYVKEGFSAKEFGEEIPGPDLTLRQLLEIRDVTKEVLEASKDMKTGSEVTAARDEKLKELAATCTDKAKRIEAVPLVLYQGGEYKIYVYRVFDDVRLVYAPEQQVAFYGGDPDNFTYPRYCLDCAFFRVYEDGKPLDTSKHYFKWNPKGAADGDLIFVPGNPGSTSRLMTYAELEVERDVTVPSIVAQLRAAKADFERRMASSEALAVSLRDDYFGVSNSLKAFEGRLAGLRDQEMMAVKKAQEEDLIAKANDPAVAEAFEAIAKGQRDVAKFAPRARSYAVAGLVNRRARSQTAYQQFIAAVMKGQSYDGELPPIPASVLTGLETVKKQLPSDDPFVMAVLGQRTPEQAVAAYEKSKLFDAEYRASLLKGGPEALASADDPLVAALRDVYKLQEELGGLQKRIDDTRGKAFDVIAAARFKVYGKTQYPDATFTLRLSYGTVKGYEAGTTMVPSKTTFNGLYERNAAFDDKFPYNLPKRWLEAKSKVALDTPYNFVCTADIIGGNSGSPIINRDAEVVGLIFDGNIESLPGNYWYDGRANRAVGVHTAGMTEAIKSVYDETELYKELIGM
ncbi:MAG TPA: S46 family peptidase [Planctomycetota bacterium]|nr:S46 family peptidase [Planctomycetota bacterium]